MDKTQHLELGELLKVLLVVSSDARDLIFVKNKIVKLVITKKVRLAQHSFSMRLTSVTSSSPASA